MVAGIAAGVATRYNESSVRVNVLGRRQVLDAGVIRVWLSTGHQDREEVTAVGEVILAV